MVRRHGWEVEGRRRLVLRQNREVLTDDQTTRSLGSGILRRGRARLTDDKTSLSYDRRILLHESAALTCDKTSPTNNQTRLLDERTALHCRRMIRLDDKPIRMDDKTALSYDKARLLPSKTRKTARCAAEPFVLAQNELFFVVFSSGRDFSTERRR